ncbi:hypothetical protein M434DRAFT_399781 [Hypoxylon sp. CO27-5]|nr:hypothetical protein M434DRAFT_399781 [Hypoxylon sp. CO27-5]
MVDHSHYTVGWICALSTELVAAQLSLDEEHDQPNDLPDGDNNCYTLGRIGSHNVVIAALPHGQYGISNATAVAKDMARSFTNVRICLMVGIGGGAPNSYHDIRLGDIVVGAIGNEKSGIFQYDYGKLIQDEGLKHTGHLNQPPQFILTAVTALNAKHEKFGNGIEEAIRKVIQGNRRLRKYQRPDPSTDLLFNSTFKHIGEEGKEESCVTTCGENKQNLVSREERDEDQDNPAIHYGLIASANQLMRDALTRDKLSKDNNVLCFEMEAAGLMNHFPCLVIRGICDYSDTHKNKLWQRYAAMAAAAYAKDLLGKIAPNKVVAGEKISEVLKKGFSEG